MLVLGILGLTMTAETPSLPRRRVASPRRVSGLFFATVLAWVALDQVTKQIATAVFATSPVDLGFVRLVDVRNQNAAFGIPGFPGLFIGVTVLVVALVLRALPRIDRPALGVAYGLVVGGALGNVLDRLFRAPGFPGGAVVDFIDLGWFPVFNLADSGITVGAVFLALLLTQLDREERVAERERARHRSVRPDPQSPRT